MHPSGPVSTRGISEPLAGGDPSCIRDRERLRSGAGRHRLGEGVNKPAISRCLHGRDAQRPTPVSRLPVSGLGRRLEVMPSAPHCMTQCPEEPEDQADYEHDHSDRPNNGDPCNEPNDQKEYAENDHKASTGRSSPLPRQRFGPTASRVRRSRPLATTVL